MAMYDIKPISKPVNFAIPKNEEIKAPRGLKNEPRTIVVPRPVPGPILKPEPMIVSKKEALIKEFEQAIKAPIDIVVELTNVGAQLHEFVPNKNRARIASRSRPISVETNLVEQLNNSWPNSPVSRELDIWLESLKNNPNVLASSHRPNKPTFYSVPPKPKPKLTWPAHLDRPPLLHVQPRIRSRPFWFSHKLLPLFIVGFLLLSFLVFGLTRKGTIGVENNIVRNGGNATANLKEAKNQLEQFKFSDAANSFALAYDDFNRASGTLNQLGASFTSIFGNLPGLGKLKSANNLIEAGQNLSKAGENLSLAFSTIYKTNPFSFLSNSGQEQGSLSKLLNEFKDVLKFAQKNIIKSDHLLADIDVSVIPQDKQPLLADFKEKVPEFQKYIGDAIDYSDFLLKFIGTSGTKTYLVLLQNNSELRATGGFPGTYALITFDNGNFKKIFVDDIYQLDAGIKQNIIPPTQLQHITPSWGLRDANWFADFPTSARKIEDFNVLDGGPAIDGVLTITPDIITKILDVVGPIDMPEYGLKLDSGNLLAQLQNEVEYKAARNKPKKIVADLQPKFFAALGRQDKEHWIEIFKIILTGAKEKHLLAYFNDSELQKVAVKNNIAGEVKSSSLAGQGSDYLQTVFTNVKGSKTDFVTDNFLNLEVTPGDGGGLGHKLTISRVHNGGGSKFGFYNRDNPDYIRVYVPKGSVFRSISGETITDFRPLLSYPDFNFKKDKDLSSLENNTTQPVSGVDVSQEGDKTVFGFWLVIKPGQKGSVVLNYDTPGDIAKDVNYQLYWQKQSGTGKDPINFSFKIPDGKNVLSQSDDLQLMGNSLILNSDLSVDRQIDIKLK